MSIVLGTLCLNEMEWLPKLYEQHKNWPGMEKWVFVEAADACYKEANPTLVSDNDLSVDGTSDYLKQLASNDARIEYIPYGLSNHSNPAQGKCQCRQKYLDACSEVRPEFVLALDADEFYPLSDQEKIMLLMGKSQKKGFTFAYRNIWRPPSIVDQPLFRWEVIGRFWKVLVCKFWRWSPGICYKNNHNSPEVNGVLLNRSLERFDRKSRYPQFVHMGFAGKKEMRLAKNQYYVTRGEGRTDHRGRYVKSRAAFENWVLGQTLPNNDRVIPYKGPIPEVFQDA